MQHRSLAALASSLALITASASASASAGTGPHLHGGSPAQQRAASDWNRTHAIPVARAGTWAVQRPFSEVEKTGYVALDSEDEFELAGLREALAKNLPFDVSMVLYVYSSSEVAPLKQLYGQFLGDRLKFLIVPQGDDPIWARDSLPMPVYLAPAAGTTTPQLGLVDSIYPQSFEPDAVFAQALSAPTVKTGTFYRGGNFMTDSRSNCFAERASEVASMGDPTAFFKKYFGCATFTELSHLGGIGDLDERMKFLSDDSVMTDEPQYATLLKAKGYVVHMIPRTGNNLETYMNTLYVNGTIFVPQMGKSTDQGALDAYKALGLTPIGVFTRTMADQGEGNIHCVTMNYPVGSFVASPLGPDFVEFAQR